MPRLSGVIRRSEKTSEKPFPCASRGTNSLAVSHNLFHWKGANVLDEYHVDGGIVAHLLSCQRASKMKGGLYHLNQIEMAYNSNRIEGSRLSREQTRYIFETRTIDGIASVDDVIEATNHFRMFDYMLDNLEAPLNTEKMKTYHHILKRGTNDADQDWFALGDWKRLENVVGAGIKTAAPSKVEETINHLLALYPQNKAMSFEEIVDFHFRYETIHPFQDGNGRTGRIIMFEQCLKNEILPFIVLDSDKHFYYRGLAEYPREKGYLLDTCRSFQDSYYDSYKNMIWPADE